METILEKGKAKAIGVSNFTPYHIQELLVETDVVAAISGFIARENN